MLLQTLAIAATVGLASPSPTPELPDAIRRSVDAAVSSLNPAIVRIDVVAKAARQGRQQRFEASGSGVLISAEGHVITNHHVAGHAARIAGTLWNNEELPARLIGTDALSDIAVIQLLPDKARRFPVAEFGDSDAMRVGDLVLAMGSPLALSQSVTLGIISNDRMVMPGQFRPFNRFVLDGEDVGSIVRWLGHDAAIYGGNSGGPLVSLDGKVIGINEMRFGLSGAIPGNLALEVAQQLIEHGRVRRGWLGLEVQPLLRGQREGGGVLLSDTVPGSPAARAGLRSGDRLVEIEGEAVNVRFPEELPLFNGRVARLPIDQEVDLVVLRGEERLDFRLRTQERQRVEPDEVELKPWGVTGRDLSLQRSREMKLESREGVLVTTVRPGGPAGGARPPIQEQDVILKLGDVAITDVAALRRETSSLLAGEEGLVETLVTFQRGAESYLTVARIGTQPTTTPPRQVKKAWLAIDLQVITRRMARALGEESMTGVRVTRVFPRSTAEAAGLREGDLILTLDGEAIPAANPEDFELLPAMIRQYRAGSIARFGVRRGGRELDLPVELGLAPELPRETHRHRDETFEFAIRDLSPIDRLRSRWDEKVVGALVTDVTQGGWAAVGHLAVGDLLLEVGGKAVTTVAEAETQLARATDEQWPALTLRVLRGVHHLYLEFAPSWESAE